MLFWHRRRHRNADLMDSLLEQTQQGLLSWEKRSDGEIVATLYSRDSLVMIHADSDGVTAVTSAEVNDIGDSEDYAALRAAAKKAGTLLHLKRSNDPTLVAFDALKRSDRHAR